MATMALAVALVALCAAYLAWRRAGALSSLLSQTQQDLRQARAQLRQAQDVWRQPLPDPPVEGQVTPRANNHGARISPTTTVAEALQLGDRQLHPLCQLCDGGDFRVHQRRMCRAHPLLGGRIDQRTVVERVEQYSVEPGCHFVKILRRGRRLHHLRKGDRRPTLLGLQFEVQQPGQFSHR